MNRAILCGAIEGAVSAVGYHFHPSAEGLYPVTISHYPAAVLFEPKFREIEGRNHGTIRYSVQLILARNGAKLSPSQRVAMLDEMEQDMLEIMMHLSQYDEVVAVDELTIEPSAERVDAHGAIALVAKADVVTIF